MFHQQKCYNVAQYEGIAIKCAVSGTSFLPGRNSDDESSLILEA